MSEIRPSAELLARVSLEKNGFHINHSLGQNFILDEGLLSEMLAEANIDPQDHVLEIGPGAGVMTAMLSDSVFKVLAVEVDQNLKPVLEDVLAGRDNVDIVFRDFLKLDVSKLINEHFGDAPYRVIANLPYYITSDILLKLVLAERKPESIVILVQKEAAERMMSEPGEKQWCSLAATLRYFGCITPLLIVPPEVFYPKPHVFSQLIRLDIYDEKPCEAKDEKIMLRLINAAFAMRRKTLANNLKAAFGIKGEDAIALLSKAGLSEKVRGEVLTMEQLCALADIILEHLKQ